MNIPNVGDIWIFNNGEDEVPYLILETNEYVGADEKLYPREDYFFNAHLLRLLNGTHYPNYPWPRRPQRGTWTKVA